MPRVLLVEDDAISRHVATLMLRRAGVQVDVAVDGIEAVERTVHHSYALILMDRQMPRMDGLTATRAIRAQRRHAHTPIVALTAHSFADDRSECLAAGMDDHLAKPLLRETLDAVLERWLARPAPGVA